MNIGMNLAIRDESEDEREGEGKFDQEAKQVLNIEEENIFKAISKIGKRPKFDVPTFFGNINLEELIDQISELEEYFGYEDIEDPNMEKFAKEKLNGHLKIWWEEIQLERNRREKYKINRWDCMIAKLK